MTGLKRALSTATGVVCLLAALALLGVLAYHAFHHGASARARGCSVYIVPFALAGFGVVILHGVHGKGPGSDESRREHHP